MKELFIVLVVLFAGCDDWSKPKEYEVTSQTITYNNHQYIKFRQTGFAGQSIVHDPDCQCKKEKNND